MTVCNDVSAMTQPNLPQRAGRLPVAVKSLFRALVFTCLSAPGLDLCGCEHELVCACERGEVKESGGGVAQVWRGWKVGH